MKRRRSPLHDFHAITPNPKPKAIFVDPLRIRIRFSFFRFGLTRAFVQGFYSGENALGSQAQYEIELRRRGRASAIRSTASTIARSVCEHALMRTPIDLCGPLFRKLKKLTVRCSETMANLMRATVERAIRAATQRRRGKAQFPVLSSREPGSLNLTNADVERLLT